MDERAEEEIWQKNLLLFPQVGAAVGRQAVPGKEINGRQLLTPESYNSSFASCQKALANDKWLEGASGGHLEVKTANGSMIEWPLNWHWHPPDLRSKLMASRIRLLSLRNS